MHEINVAVVGCGFVADKHLSSWKKVPQAQVLAVCDLNKERAKNAARIWRIPNYYTSFSELLKRDDISLVDICTPPQVHKSLAVLAMESKLHILIEKPLTMRVKEADEILRCQKINGVQLGVIHNFLFNPAILKARSIVKRGEVGEVIGVEVEILSTGTFMASNKQHWCHKLPGGRFGEMLAHPIYLIREFIGNFEVENVWVSRIGDYTWMRFDELYAVFDAGDKLGRTYISFNSPRNAICLNIFGKEATLRVNLTNATITKMPRVGESRLSRGFDALRQASQLTVSTITNMAKIVFGRWRSEHETYIRMFVDSLIYDRAPPVTVQSAYEVVRILEELCKRIDAHA